MLPIILMGDPLLRQISEPVANPTAPEIQDLAAAMVETMLAAPGVGLAAPQVGRSLRMLAMRVMSQREEAPNPGEPPPTIVLINPEIAPLDSELELGWEGCLSAPDLRGLVPRCARIGYRAWLPDGRRVEAVAEGFQARILQHEYDHLDGLLYLDRMRDMRSLGYADALLGAARAAGSASP